MSISRRTLLAAGAAAVLGACASGRTRAAVRAAVTTTTGAVPSPPSSTTTPVAGGPARYVPNGPRTRSSIALTFHGSGDPALTDQMLSIAARLHAPITVFAVGTWLAANPAMAGKILAAGHELANHTYTHPALASQPRATIESEIVRCRDVLRAQTGSGGRWFRPSGVEGAPTATILTESGAAGYPVVVGFDVDPLDYQDPGADAIVSRTAAKLQPGSIVSLHLGHAGTVAAFERLVTGARNRGLEPVVLSHLLQA